MQAICSELRENATAGRDLALAHDIPSQIADFQMDLSDIERKSDDLRTALVNLREAAVCLLLVGHAEQIKRALEKSGEIFSQLKTWDALCDVLILATTVLPALQLADRSSVCTFLVRTIQNQIRSTGWQGSRDGLWRLNSDLQSAPGGGAQPMPEQKQFLLDLLQACYDYTKGKHDAALATMQRLDSLSANGFQLANFLTQASAS